MNENSHHSLDVSYEGIFRILISIFAVIFVYFLRDIIFLLFISILITLIIVPAVDFLESKKIPRIIAAMLIFAIIFIVFGSAFFIIAPPLAKQLSQLSLIIPQYLADNSFIIDNALLKTELSGPLQNLLVQASGYFKNITSSFFAGIFNLLGGVMSALLTIVISFYLIIEEDGVERFVKNVIPQKMQRRSLNVIKKVQVKLGRWFVGQVSLGFIVGIMSYVGLNLLGITEYALVLAIIAGMLELVPYVGPILSAIPAIIIALTISLNDALLTFVLYFFIQQFENYLIVPKVMEKSVNLHPIIIILAIMIGGKLAGVMGAMLAVPVTAIITIILDDVNHNHAVN